MSDIIPGCRERTNFLNFVVLVYPRLLLINLSLQLGEFPTEWKKANVIPIYKKKNCQHKSNYRPILLLSSISKIQEKIVFKNLYDFLISVGFF